MTPIDLEASPRRGEPCTFRIVLLHGVWRVSRNQAFYGDFLNRGTAVRAACQQARTEEGQGRSVQVFEPPSPVPLVHRDRHLDL